MAALAGGSWIFGDAGKGIRMSRLWGGLAVAALFSVFAGVGSANTISLTGSIGTDDQLTYIEFVASSANVSIDSLGYGGGTNAASNVIPAGGFAPVLSLFDESGGSTFSPSNQLIDTTFPFAACSGATDPMTGACFDVTLSESTLTSGDTYLLVLTEYDSSPNNNTLGDGFSESGNGDFTANNYFCGASAFCDPAFNARTGDWALDLSGVTSAQIVTPGSTVPEPVTVFPLFAVFGGAVLLLRRRGRQVIQQ